MTNELPVDFIIDFETFGTSPDSAVINVAAICFKEDIYNPPTFQELINSAIEIKFDLNSQRQPFSGTPRTFEKGAIDWWKTQSADARQCLAPTFADVGIKEGTKQLLDYITANGVDHSKSFGWCRGMSFDFPLLKNLIQTSYEVQETNMHEPCKFWNQRDIRTAIERTLMKRGMTVCPLPKGLLEGFIPHNCVHDCAKDIMMLIYAQRFALGLDEFPSEDEIDPVTVKLR